MIIRRKQVTIPAIQMEVILIQDLKTGGFTAYFVQLPNIITEGADEESAINNLVNTFKLVNEIVYKEENNLSDIDDD